MNDDSLALTGDTPTSDAALADPVALVKPRRFTIDEVLASARRIERTASICLAGDLQAEYDELLGELATLVTATGELLEDDADAALGQVSSRARVEQINARVSQLRRGMAEKMWHVRFLGMSSDDWATFVKKHMPKDEKANRTEFFNLLIAETAIDPVLSLDQVRQLRKALTQRAMNELTSKAWEACTEGGVDVPKSPLSLRKMGFSGA